MRHLLFLLPIALAACVKPGGEYPSLAPRAAEAIDLAAVDDLHLRPFAKQLGAGPLLADGRGGLRRWFGWRRTLR